MAHFCKIDENNIVLSVIVIANENCGGGIFPDSEPIGIAFCKSLFGQDTNWLQTSYNNNFRYRYAAIGYTYSSMYDAFIMPKPYASWTLNLTTFDWDAPTPYPNDDLYYEWDEPTLSWILIEG